MFWVIRLTGYKNQPFLHLMSYLYAHTHTHTLMYRNGNSVHTLLQVLQLLIQTSLTPKIKTTKVTEITATAAAEKMLNIVAGYSVWLFLEAWLKILLFSSSFPFGIT